jgi:hypothetical protein
LQFSFDDPANKESIKSLGPDSYVLAQRGIIDKEKLYIPQDQLQRYDVSVLIFRISEYEITNKYMSHKPPLHYLLLKRSAIEFIYQKK